MINKIGQALALHIVLATLCLEVQCIEPNKNNKNLCIVYQGGDNCIYTGYALNDGSWVGNIQGVAGWRSENGITLTTFKDKIYMAFQGTDKKMYTAYSKDNTNWQGLNQVEYWQAQNSIGLTTYNNKLYIGYQGSDNHIYVGYSEDGIKWHKGNEKIYGWKSQNGVSLTTFKNRIYMAFQGTEGKMHTAYFDGNGWHGPYEVSYYQAKNGIGLTEFNGKLYLGYQGSDGGIYVGHSSDGCSNWEYGNVSISTSQPWKTQNGVALTTFNNHLYVAFQGTGGNMHTGFSSDGIHWNGAQNVSYWQAKNIIGLTAAKINNHADWMQDNLKQLGKLKIKNLCMVATHVLECVNSKIHPFLKQ